MALPTPTPGTAALVTGASAGIGAALAKKIAAQGYNVVLVARRAERLKALADLLAERHGVEALAVPADLTDPDDRASLCATVRSAGMDISVLVNNAGFATGGPYADSSTSREVEQVRILVEAPVELTAMYLPAMIARGSGAILNVASTAGMQPVPFSAGYSAAKAHALAFSRALHDEVRRHGVSVTALCPGPVKTEFWDVAGESPMEKVLPRPVWVSVERVAETALDGLSRNRRVVVPGTMVRLAALGAAVVPDSVKSPVMGLVMRPRGK